MHRRVCRWLIVAGLVWSCPAGVWSQDASSSSFTAPVPVERVAPPPPLPDEEGSPSARIEHLEAAVRDARLAAEADKSKAARAASIRFGGRIFLDSLLFSQNPASAAALGNAQNATYLRVARFEVEGDVSELIGYRAEFEFGGRRTVMLDDLGHTADLFQEVLFKDAYLEIKELPLADRVRIGHFKEPFSLEEMISNRFVTFMDRSLINVFAPKENIGVMGGKAILDERATWAIGGFRTVLDVPPQLIDDRGAMACTARGTWLPWYDEASEGRGLLHLGLAYSFRDAANPVERIRQRPEVGLMANSRGEAMYAVDTGDFDGVENIHLLEPEVAMVYGPFSAQAEYVMALYLRESNLANPWFHGCYVQASYFLTGEHRPYQRSQGRFTRVTPFTNFFRVRAADRDVATGWGAWELAYRYSWLDLNDRQADILGGQAADHTFGVNWYLNPYTRMTFNYVHSKIARPEEGPEAALDIVEMRAQIDF
jgi:phosphate-selective porin OprO/OprP